jgi:hypothetical protein
MTTTRTEAEALLAAVEKMIPGTWNAEAIAAMYRTTMDNARGIVALRNTAPAIIRALLAEVDAAVAERDAARAVALEACEALEAIGNYDDDDPLSAVKVRRATTSAAYLLDIREDIVDRLRAALTGAKP